VQTEEAQDEHDDHDEPYQVDDAVHELSFGISNGLKLNFATSVLFQLGHVAGLFL
jgi:hypothetical protein